MRHIKSTISLLMLLTMSMAKGYAQESNLSDVAKNLDAFNQIYKQLDMMYVDSLQPDITVREGIDAMLASLDPYTEYYPASESDNLKTMLTGRYAGIGAMVRMDFKTKEVIIDEPYEGMPAAAAGLKKGDVILSINDSSMVGKAVSYVSQRLRGEPGTTLILKIKRRTDNDKVLKVKLTRQAIQLPSLPYYGIIPGTQTGYLLLTQFTEGCAKDVRRAVITMRHQGMKDMILDLRENGGGSLSEAVDIVGMFTPKGTRVVTTKGRLKRTNNEYKTTQEPIDTLMPLVVLVNGNTASASEITSGSLQDLDRAVVMGMRTYGKGLVQQTVDLKHDAMLKLTVSKYFIPSGRCIQAINYKHTGGGYREHIPDSLTHEFHTRGGRTVRDGGGIKPDVEVRPDSVPNIVAYLFYGSLDSTEVALKYETEYIASHDTIAQPQDFHLTDEDYEQFKQMVAESGFDYDRTTAKTFDKLVEAARFEGYYDDAKAELEALKAKLTHNISRELDNNRQRIQQELEKDIITSYHFQKGRIIHSLSRDKQVGEALNLLNDSERYNNILQK